MPNIDIIAPDGTPGSIPEEQKYEALNQGYKLPAPNAAPTGHTEVMSPDFQLGTIPTNQLYDAEQQGYYPAGHPMYDYRKDVKSNIDLLKSGDKKKINEKFSNADFVTPDGKYKMLQILPDGNTKEVEMNDYDAAVGLGNNTLVLRDPHAQAALTAGILNTKDNAESYLKGVPAAFARGVAKLNVLLAKGANLVVPKSWEVPDEVLDKLPGQYSQGILGRSDQSSPQAIIDTLSNNTQLQNPGVAGKLGEEIPGLLAGGAVGKGLGVGLKAATSVEALAPAAEFLAGASKSSPYLSAAARGATQSLAEMSPSIAVRAAVDKDPQGALESATFVTGLGFVLGLGGKALETALAKPTGGFLSSTDDLIARNFESLGIKSEAAPEIKKAALEVLAARGGKASETAEGAINAVARGGQLQPLVSKAAKFGDASIDPILNTLGSVEEKATALLNRSVDNAEMNLIKETAGTFSKDLGKLATADGKIKLTDLLDFTEKAGMSVTDKASVENLVRQEVFKVSRQELMDATGKAVVSSGDNALLQKLEVDTLSMNLADQLKILKPAAKDKIMEGIVSLVEHKLSHVAAGLAHGIPVVGPMVAGAATSSAIKYIKNILRNQDVTIGSRAASFLNKSLDGSNAASYGILTGVHKVAQKLDEIEPFIKAVGTKSAGLFVPRHDPIKEILGDDANGLSKNQQFNKLQTQVAKLQNPELLQQHLNDVSAPFMKDHPELANQIMDDVNKKIQFINSIIPKDMTPPSKFQPKKDYVPTKAEMDTFTQQLRIAQNPFVLLDHLKNNTLTPKQVAVAAQLNPAILQQMRDKIELMSASGKVDLSYQKRLQMSILMGQAMDNSLNDVQALQSVYATTQPPMSQPVKKATKGGSKIKAERLPSSMTTAQRISK